MISQERKQELFNIAWNGIKSQGFQQSVLRNEDGTVKGHNEGPRFVASCAYRDPQGRKCAVGWMIPDEKYDPKLENRLASSREVCEAAGLNADYYAGESHFARQLQMAHDMVESSTPEGMEKNLRAFALGYALDIPQDA
jgi:hypothetical protein